MSGVGCVGIVCIGRGVRRFNVVLWDHRGVVRDLDGIVG